LRLLRSSRVTPNCARVGGSAGTERGGAVLAAAGQADAPGSIGERVRFVASAAHVAQLARSLTAGVAVSDYAYAGVRENFAQA
jgi:hypothetical protein